MQFRRRTNLLSGLPHAVYVVVFLLIISLFFANKSYTEPQNINTLSASDTTAISINPENIEDSLFSKPEIFVPDVQIIPDDTIETIAEKADQPNLEKNNQAISKLEESKKIEEDKKTDKNKKDKFTEIGKDRPLIAFIPGTNGKPGKMPNHNCGIKGELIMIFTVNEAGDVIRAGRSGGIKNDCATTAAVIWLKQYVKAKKSDSQSKGFYTINF